MKSKDALENAKKMVESYRKRSNKPIFITEKDGDYVVAKGWDELKYAKENGYKLFSDTSISTTRGIGSTSTSRT